jgi:hypothetical protein
MELKLDPRSIHSRNLIQRHHVYSRQYGGAASTRSVLWHAKATFRRKDIQVSWLRQLMQPLFLILAEEAEAYLQRSDARRAKYQRRYFTHRYPSLAPEHERDETRVATSSMSPKGMITRRSVTSYGVASHRAASLRHLVPFAVPTHPTKGETL